MLKKSHELILIVDDIKANRMLLASIIDKNTDYKVMMACNGSEVIESIDSIEPDLILLDIMLPDIDGYKIAEILKSKEKTKNIPIIFITSITSTKGIAKAFQCGGVDYVTKPFNKIELLSRIEAHLSIKRMQDELQYKNRLLADREKHLMGLVAEQTSKIENTAHSLVMALESANSFNDNDTGVHIKRVSAYSAQLAIDFGCDSEFVKRVQLYSPLHDVGKVGIADSILKKPGKLTSEEFTKMQEHVVIGSKMLDNSEIDRMAFNIAAYHHEKFAGTGYQKGLKRESIPLEARIVALTDVYDALGSNRPYKAAFPQDKIESIILENKGTHFDPELVDVLLKNIVKYTKIKENIES